MKESWIKNGDCPTHTLFRRVKVRKSKNEILTLKLIEKDWIEGQDYVSKLIVESLKGVLCPMDDTRNDSGESAEQFDLVLRELDLPVLTSEQAASLTKPISRIEVRTAMF